MLASALASGASIVSADVALSSDETLVGSFTVDGLTYAVNPSGLLLVAVDASAVSDGVIAIPASVVYDGTPYDVTAIGPYAFYLSGATQVGLPATIADVDERAFRSSDVERVEVDQANAIYASSDGIIYDASLTRLLLIPGGRQGAVRIASSAEEVDASAFSHCAGVDAISVDAGSADFASWDGLLYDASGTTLLRVPAGAVDITIREGCTTIASGAMEGCAKLECINAPASVTSISPNVFESVPTVSLPASMLASDNAPAQLTAMVALLDQEEYAPQVIPSDIEVLLSNSDDESAWESVGFLVERQAPIAAIQSAQTAKATVTVTLAGQGGTVYWTEPTTGTKTGTIVTWGFTRATTGGWKLRSDGTFQYGTDTRNLVYATLRGIKNSGWSTSAEGSPIPVGADQTSYTTLYALYPSRTVTWDASKNGGQIKLDDGASVGEQTVTQSIAKSIIAPQVEERFGYRFLGWAASDKETDESKCWKPGTAHEMPTTNQTYYAVWVSDYTIHFDGNVVDDEAHPATVPANMPAAHDQAVILPTASRFGYIFKGWATHPSGSTSGDNKVFAPSESAMNLTDTPGGTVTLYALWALKYDADMPVGAPTDVTFALDSTNTGQVKAVPADYTGDFSPADMEAMGSTHECAIESRMAVPVAVTSVSAESISEDAFAKVLSSTDGSPADQQLSFVVSSGDEGATLQAGDSSELSGLFVPEATEGTPVARLPIDYGLELAETAVVVQPDGEAAVPVANVCYTLDVIEGMASKWGFFINDGGTPVTPTRIKEAAEAIAADDDGSGGSSSPWYDAFHGYLEDDTRGYVAWGDGTTYPVRIIGINHDDKPDGSGKAGLTFQFVDCLNTPYHFNSTNTNAGGWGASELRRELNAETGEIRKQIPDRLANLLVPVTKRYYDGPTGLGATLRSSEDVLFLLSYFEITSRDARTFGGYSLMKNEGTIYAYYGPTGLDVSGAVNEDCMKRFTQSDKRSPVLWWQRSCWTDVRTQFCLVDWDGNVNGCLPAADPTINSYVCPCFCL